MGSHLIGGQFQSDKYPTCPPGKVPLSVNDKTAQDLLWQYARRRRAVDAEFSDDLETALRAAGYELPELPDAMAEDAKPEPCLRLTDRLRGVYTVPVNDGAGPLYSKMTFTPEEPFFTPPIQKEAAERIEELEAAVAELLRDAERYRWLRNDSMSYQTARMVSRWFCGDDLSEAFNSKELDAAVDAEIARDRQPGGGDAG